MKRYLLATILLIAFFTPVHGSESSPSLKSFERGSWQHILQSHAGRPTLIHFWGVTCGPCKVELPLLRQFMKDHAGVDVVTISTDLVPNLPDAAQSMLDKAGLRTAENWIFSDGFVERLRFEIDPTWQGDIPRTILVSRNGTAATIEGSAEIHDLEKWSNQQTAAPATPLDRSVKNDDFFTHLHTDKAMANVTVSPGRVGPVDITIQLETTNEEPLTAKAVRVTLSNGPSGKAQQTLQATLTSDGQWHVQTSMPVAGPWMLGLSITFMDNDKLDVESPILIK
jgi:thiol-disulfide isomerase/thioredoxin